MPVLDKDKVKVYRPGDAVPELCELFCRLVTIYRFDTKEKPS